MIQVSDSISYNAASTDAAEVVDDTEETAAAVGLGCKVLFLNRCHGVTLLPGMFFFFLLSVGVFLDNKCPSVISYSH